MGRKLYYRNSYGYWERDRRAEKAGASAGGSSLMRTVYTVLIVLAALMVLASLHH